MSHISVLESKKDREDETQAYKEAFDYFDWNKSGTIPNSVNGNDITRMVPLTIV